MVLDRGPDRRQVEREQLLDRIDADRALRVADRHVLEGPAAPVGVERRGAAVRPAGEVLRGQLRAAHVDACRSLAPVIVGRISPAAVWIENVVGVGPAAPAQVEDRLARAVARQLGLRAVRVEDPQARDEARLLGFGQQQDPVGEDSRCGRRRSRGCARASARTAAAWPRRSGSRCRAPATSRSPRRAFRLRGRSMPRRAGGGVGAYRLMRSRPPARSRRPRRPRRGP